MGFFSKGITLPKRHLVTSLTLIDTPVPDTVVLPLRQYIGQPSQATVTVGDTVKTGQIISECTDATCLPVHATISGTVTDISAHLDPRGSTTESVTIQSDGTDTWIEPPHVQDTALDTTDILDRIRSSGLIAKGLFSTPLDKDLAPIDQPKTHLYLDGTDITRKIDTLIINCLDAEPSLGVNRYLAGMEHSSLPCGIDALKRITGAERVIFAVDKHLSPSAQLKDMVKADEEEATSIITVNGRRYPAALPLVLLKTLLAREVPLPYGHPRDVGAAVYDIETVISIGERVTSSKAQVDTLITIGGDAMAKNGIARVRIGMSIGSLIDSLGGLKADAAKIILGGPMTGMAHYDLATPITKEVTGLFAMTREQIQLSTDYRECINCGMCVKVCPVNLLPGIISLYCAKDKFDLAEAAGLFSCIECGACDYVCPSRRPLVHLFRHAKNQLME
jgi:Na+-translocating ferredoxin:NAD+ oxidoreductase subunit C